MTPSADNILLAALVWVWLVTAAIHLSYSLVEVHPVAPMPDVEDISTDEMRALLRQFASE